MSELSQMLEGVRRTLDASPSYDSYAERHDVRSASILTVTDAEIAASITDRIEDRIRNKVVVEIGGGIGLLSIFMGAVARKVWCIEANPIWASCFAHILLEMKPKNVSFLLGSADEFVDTIKADVAVICTHSGVAAMNDLGRRLASEVIDVYGEMIEANPQGFDPIARKLRPFV